jgi:hypothetical protein
MDQKEEQDCLTMDDDYVETKKPPAEYATRNNESGEEEVVTPCAVPVSHRQDRASAKKGGRRQSSDDKQKAATTDGGVPQQAAALEPSDRDDAAALDDGGAATSPGSHKLERASLTKEKRGRKGRHSSNMDKKPAVAIDRGVQLAPGIAALEDGGAASSPGSQGLERASLTKKKRDRKGRHSSNLDEKQTATIDQGIQLAPGVAPGANNEAFVSGDVEEAPSVPTCEDVVSLDSSRDDEAGGAQASSSPDHVHAFDAFVVHTQEDRLAALSRLTQDAPLAQIVNESSSRQSQDHQNSEERRRKLFLLGGFILILVLSAILVPLAGLGKLSGSQEAETVVSLTSNPTTLKPSGVPSRGPTSAPSGVPSRAPTTPAPTSSEFSFVTSLLFANPEEDRPRDPTSPQWKALAWLAEVDVFTSTVFNSNLASRDQLLRRYALATLYYATNGDG